jgi:D-amino-acid dehydrogenase
LGAGVIGVTSAYYLARAGHDVTVVERNLAAAEETSFGNSGQISPGYAAPWAGPGLPLTALKWILTDRHSPLIVRPTADPRMYLWIARLLKNCTAGRYAINKGRMVRLAEYSRDCLVALRAQTAIGYDQRSLGTLQLFRTPKQLDDAGHDIAVLKRYGVAFELLDRAGCVAAEPALGRTQIHIAGGLRLPGDETGDCNLFTKALAAIAEGLGVRFRYGVTVKALAAGGGRIESVVTDGGSLQADAIVMALGSVSPLLAGPLGLDLPVYPVKGYSITVPITDAAGAPRSTVMDESLKIAVTRLGNRIRAGGRAELCGYDKTLRLGRRAALDYSVRSLFPEGGDLGKASFWTGLRPMTPDGTPVIGKTAYANLYLNTGHGTLGWTMACGSGRVIADIISGTKADIEIADLAISRYGRAPSPL